MAKSNYDAFNRFDLNDCADHFDYESRAQWMKIDRFVVADGQDYDRVMEESFGFDEPTEGEYEAFEAGVKYTLTKLNKAFKAAGLALEIAEVDLVEAMGFMLVRTDDTPETFAKRALKKPVAKVESWV